MTHVCTLTPSRCRSRSTLPCYDPRVSDDPFLRRRTGFPRGASHGHDEHGDKIEISERTSSMERITHEVKQETSEVPFPPKPSWIVGLTSLFFILLQSACTAFMAISGLRLVIGIGSLAAVTSAAKLLDSVHGEKIRIPMTILALIGSIINLTAIWRVRTLRARPSSQWRVRPVSGEKKRAETLQIVLAALTLVLIAVEGIGHVHTFGSLFR
jgi:hypothetical protein